MSIIAIKKRPKRKPQDKLPAKTPKVKERLKDKKKHKADKDRQKHEVEFVFLVDISGSMSAENGFKNAQLFVEKSINAMRAQYANSLVTLAFFGCRCKIYTYRLAAYLYPEKLISFTRPEHMFDLDGGNNCAPNAFFHVIRPLMREARDSNLHFFLIGDGDNQEKEQKCIDVRRLVKRLKRFHRFHFYYVYVPGNSLYSQND